jgi:L-asparaginase II
MGTTETIPHSPPQPNTPVPLQNGILCSKILDDNTITTSHGPVIENTHRIHIAVTNAHGDLLYTVGNPWHMILARSAAKPIQSRFIPRTDAADRFNFSDADIAPNECLT